MSPRPLHTWKSFWFGILVLAFLGWAWLVSMDSLKGAAVLLSSGWKGLAQYEGEVCLVAEGGFFRWGAVRNFDVVNHLGTGGSPEMKTHWINLTADGVVVRHGLLMVLFLVLWSAFLAWRYHRIRRLTNVSP